MEDQIAKLDVDLKELTSKNDEIEYELEKTRDKAFKLDRQLADSLMKNKQLASSIPASLAQSLDQNGHVLAGTNKFNQQNSRNDSKSTNLNDKQVSFHMLRFFF